MPTINTSLDSCPCGSGHIVRECCLHADGTLQPVKCVTQPKPPKTNYSNLGCYLASSADCCKTITREHYISETLLKELNIGKAPILVTGLHWLHGKPKEVSTNELTARILCQRHNNALSSLDSLALRLMQVFNALNAKQSGNLNNQKEEVYLFNGYDVERWFLKVLCGMVVSGNASTNGAAIRGWKPPEKWLKILLGEEEFPQGWGLYLRNAVPGASFFGSWGFKFASLGTAPEIKGAQLTFNSCPFLLAMDDPPIVSTNTPFAGTTYRPREIAVSGKGVIMFAWDMKGDDKCIAM